MSLPAPASGSQALRQPVVAPDGSPAAMSPAEPCPHCQHLIVGNHCANCGELRQSRRNYSVREFAAEVVETVTNADSRLVRTFRSLLLRPGALTVEYMRGNRTGFMRPLQLFLIVNVIYFVWAAYAGERVFSTALSGHLGNSNYGETVSRLVAARIRERQDTVEGYTRAFNDAASVQAKTLIVIMVPMFAMLVAALQWRKRRPAVHHLVFALHVFATLLLLAIAQRYVVHLPVLHLGSFASTGQAERFLNEFIGIVMMAAMAIYTTLALRRAYGDRWTLAIVKGALLG